MCNSGCNTFKAAAVTLNIRRQVRNSGAAYPNTYVRSKRTCVKRLGLKLLSYGILICLFVFFSLCACVEEMTLKFSAVFHSESLKLEGFYVEVLYQILALKPKNKKIKKNPCFCFIAPVLNMRKWVWGGSVFIWSLKIQRFLFLYVEKMTNFKYDYSTFKFSDELCLKTFLPYDC